MTVSGLKRGLVYPKKNSYYACVLASDCIQQIMASGVRDSSTNSRGLFLQLHNVSSADLLWDEKKSRKRKANVSSDYFAVERLISRRTSHGTVSSLAFSYPSLLPFRLTKREIHSLAFMKNSVGSFSGFQSLTTL